MLQLRIIKILHARRFKGCWMAYECDGVEPAYRKREEAIEYACHRFGGGRGEVHVYAEDGRTIERVIEVDGGTIQEPRATISEVQ